MLLPKSAAQGIVWPALPNPTDSLLLALQYQLEQSQWRSPLLLQQMQLLQLTALLSYASRAVPFYRERLLAIPRLGNRCLTMSDLRSVPILTRAELQQNGDKLLSDRVPSDHLPTHIYTTSGSTGRPVRVTGTKVTDIFYRAFNLRYHLWHQRNLRAKVAVIGIDASQESDGARRKKIWAEVFPSGVVVTCNSGQPIERQLDFLQRSAPEYLLTYPSNLLDLVRGSQRLNLKLPSILAVNTFGELLTTKIRQVCREVWNLPIIDAYSAKEAGMIALQCPQSDCYHIQSENVLVEILDEYDRPCQPGQTGRVVLTVLHNYAMPLIRYELGDYAEVGDNCVCGRSLPILKRIVGRQRNMMVLPSGERVWPNYIVSEWASLGPISQIQVVQFSLTELEIRMAVARKLTNSEREQLRQKIERDFSGQFALRFKYMDSIPRSAGGKYEDFICLVN